MPGSYFGKSATVQSAPFVNVYGLTWLLLITLIFLTIDRFTYHKKEFGLKSVWHKKHRIWHWCLQGQSYHHTVMLVALAPPNTLPMFHSSPHCKVIHYSNIFWVIREKSASSLANRPHCSRLWLIGACFCCSGAEWMHCSWLQFNHTIDVEKNSFMCWIIVRT